MIRHPLQAGALSLIPFIGIISFAAGCVMGVVSRRKALLLFCVPFLVSECYVAIAGSFSGHLRGTVGLVPVGIFMVVQFGFIGYFAFINKSAPLAALALAIFSMSYALFALFVGGMAFADDWI